MSSTAAKTKNCKEVPRTWGEWFSGVQCVDTPAPAGVVEPAKEAAPAAEPKAPESEQKAPEPEPKAPESEPNAPPGGTEASGRPAGAATLGGWFSKGGKRKSKAKKSRRKNRKHRKSRKSRK